MYKVQMQRNSDLPSSTPEPSSCVRRIKVKNVHFRTINDKANTNASKGLL